MKQQRFIPCDEFDCVDCGQHVISLPPVDPPPIVCCTCAWLNRYVEDRVERERLRARLCGPLEDREGSGS